MTDVPPAARTPASAITTGGHYAAPWWVPQMRDVLALLSTAMFAGMLFAPYAKTGVNIDQDLKGAIVLQWGLVMGWYFGSSKAATLPPSAPAP